jgi:hypothetical protein
LLEAQSQSERAERRRISESEEMMRAGASDSDWAVQRREALESVAQEEAFRNKITQIECVTGICRMEFSNLSDLPDEREQFDRALMFRIPRGLDFWFTQQGENSGVGYFYDPEASPGRRRVGGL